LAKARIALIALIIGLVTEVPCNSLAGSLSTTGHYGVDVAITLTKNSDVNFGTVKAGVADTYTISTAAAVTHSGTGAWLYGTPSAGNITIAGSSIGTVSVSVGSFTANGGVTPQNATCSYNGGASGSCTINNAAAPGAGKTLLLGVDAVVNGTQTAGAAAAPTFTVTVTYP
jgi:hypothetical protein